MSSVLGILGGMGPLATSDFYKRIVDMTNASQDSDHIETIIYSNSKIPKRVEFIMGESSRNPEPVLAETAEKLISAGADVIAMPCITAHYFIDNLKEIAYKHGVTFIDAIDLTVRELKNRNKKTVGILASIATISAGFLQKKLAAQNIECVVPDLDFQEKVSSLIYDKIKAGIPVSPSEYNDIFSHLADKGAEIMIIACTDISTVGLEKEYPNKYIDILSLLASECIKLCIDT